LRAVPGTDSEPLRWQGPGHRAAQDPGPTRVARLAAASTSPGGRRKLQHRAGSLRRPAESELATRSGAAVQCGSARRVAASSPCGLEEPPLAVHQAASLHYRSHGWSIQLYQDTRMGSALPPFPTFIPQIRAPSSRSVVFSALTPWNCCPWAPFPPRSLQRPDFLVPDTA